MANSLQDVIQVLDDLLRPGDFRDYCPNGLQIEGCSSIDKLVTGVTASQDFIDAAIDSDADAILVHHGFFWKGESPVIQGIKKNRIKALLENEISLLAYHLPIDAHPALGNNAQLALRLGFEIEADLDRKHKSNVGVWGRLKQPCSGEELSRRINTALNREPFHISGSTEVIETIGWCTGSAQSYIELAHSHNVDAYLSGEVSEQTVHFARETGMHFFAAGHHATERYGVRAVGDYLEKTLGLTHQFIDIDNPV